MKNNYRKLKFSILLQTVLVTALTVLVGGVLLKFVIDGIYNDSFARFFVDALVFLNVNEKTAIHLYWKLVGDNKTFYMIVGYLILFALFFYVALSQMTKYLDQIDHGIENIISESTDPIHLITELKPIEIRLNEIKATLKRQELEATEGEKKKNDLVLFLAHDLKTPLTSMKVLADSLVGQQGVPEELYQEFMSDITAEIDRENKIITDLLSLVKMDKKAADVNITHMDINQLLEDILKRLRPIADRRNIDLILDCFRPVDADVDEVKFTLAVSNLVENGIKYNVDDGWVRVSLDADHKYFYITVADSGMGIPEDSIERIFERFYRVDKSHSKEIGGTGLGLAITKSSVAMHHGTIKVFSKEGEGTTFSVRIPLSYIPS